MTIWQKIAEWRDCNCRRFVHNTFAGIVCVLFVVCHATAAEQQRDDRVQIHQLIATPETVAWGYYDAASKPVLTIDSGDIVEGVTVLASAGFLQKLGVKLLFREAGGPHKTCFGHHRFTEVSFAEVSVLEVGSA